eukprot:15050365-Heterocapsa_arctica.AAC.1
MERSGNDNNDQDEDQYYPGQRVRKYAYSRMVETIRIKSSRNKKRRRPPSKIKREGWTNKSKKIN